MTKRATTAARTAGAIALVLFTAPVHADIDWARGLVTADGIGVANRAAPTPAAARGPARRMAEDAARKQLATKVGAVPLATGGTLAAKLRDDTVKAAVERAVADALVVAAEPETDGSWKVTLGVPLEALRLAVSGRRTLGADGDTGAAVVIVEGSGAKPALGYRVAGISAATVFVKEAPVWASGAPRVKGKAAKGGKIDVAVKGATEATLFVVVGK